MIKLKKRDHDDLPEMMISPMIDMIFLLLVFFILSTMYMSEVRTLPIRLPTANQTTIETQTKFTVTIKKDGTFWIEDQYVTENDILRLATIAKEKDSHFRVVLRGEDEVPYKVMIGLLDSLRGIGVERVSLAASAAGGTDAS